MSKYSIAHKQDDFSLSEESAIEEVKKFLTYYDIDIDSIDDADVISSFERALDSITRFVRRNILEVTEDKDGKIIIVQHLGNGESLTYGELGAKHKLAMDRVPKDESYKRIYALMGSLSGVGSAGIEKLKSRDLSVVEVLGTVFSNA